MVVSSGMIASQQDLAKWLANKPAQWGQLIAIRASLRVLPLTLMAFEIPDEIYAARNKKQFVLFSFRAGFLGWAAARYGTGDGTELDKTDPDATGLRAAARSSTNSHLVGHADAAAFAAAAAAAAISSTQSKTATILAASASKTLDDSTLIEVQSNNIFLGATIANSGLLHDQFWHAIDADAEFLSSNNQISISTQAIWLRDVRGDSKYAVNIPIWVRRPFDKFANGQLGKIGPWSFWTKWYRGILGSVRSPTSVSRFGEEFDKQLADKADIFWFRDSDEVMEEIKSLSQISGTKAVNTDSKSGRIEIGGLRAEARIESPSIRGVNEQKNEPLSQIDAVQTHSDEPTEWDQLGREPFARALAERIDEVRVRSINGGNEDGFAIHLHAPWGAGKTSTLKMMERVLTSGDLPLKTSWVVVNFNAWRHERRNPPWWPLIECLKDNSVQCLRHRKESDRAGSVQQIWRSRKYGAIAGPYLVAFLVLIAVFLFVWILLSPIPPDDGATTVRTIFSLLTSAWAAFATFILLGRSVVFGSSDTATLFKKLSGDPLRWFEKLYVELVQAVGDPICIFIDDLDRCSADYVVDLLEGIQTAFRHKNVVYVVAADKNWICQSFENRYSAFSDAVSNPGQPLGYLFLEKLFQLSTPVPGMSHSFHRSFVNNLLYSKAAAHGVDRSRARASPVDSDAYEIALANKRRSIKAAAPHGVTAADVEKFLANDKTDVARDAAILEITASGAAHAESQHRLEKYSELMAENPRLLKRLVNAYGFRVVIRLAENSNVDYDALARWTILEQRLPAFADVLVQSPDLVDTIVKGAFRGKLESLPEALKPFASLSTIESLIGERSSSDHLSTEIVREITRGLRA